MIEHPAKTQYNLAVNAVATLLATDKDEVPRVSHVNQARKILRPHISDDLRTALVMR